MASQTFKTSELTAKKIANLATQIKNGAIAVLPTDTIYGIVASAKNPKSVEKVYLLRKRTSSKPMIILIDSEEEIFNLGVKITSDQITILSSLWPNPISIVVDCSNKTLHYLHRGKKTLAFRIPNNDFLLQLLKITGPLVAPSANFEGEKPAKNIEEAKKYFNESVPIYIDSGELKSPPSTVAKLENSKLVILRQGAAQIPRQFLK